MVQLIRFSLCGGIFGAAIFGCVSTLFDLPHATINDAVGAGIGVLLVLFIGLY